MTLVYIIPWKIARSCMCNTTGTWPRRDKRQIKTDRKYELLRNYIIIMWHIWSYHCISVHVCVCVCVYVSVGMENASIHEQIIQPLPAVTEWLACCMRRMAWGDPTAPVGRRLKVFDDNPQSTTTLNLSSPCGIPPINHDVSICTLGRRPTKARTQENQQTAHHCFNHLTFRRWFLYVWSAWNVATNALIIVI
jgi:hypothetical protein